MDLVQTGANHRRRCPVCPRFNRHDPGRHRGVEFLLASTIEDLYPSANRLPRHSHYVVKVVVTIHERFGRYRDLVPKGLKLARLLITIAVIQLLFVNRSRVPLDLREQHSQNVKRKVFNLKQ